MKRMNVVKVSDTNGQEFGLRRRARDSRHSGSHLLNVRCGGIRKAERQIKRERDPSEDKQRGGVSFVFFLLLLLFFLFATVVPSVIRRA